MRHKNIAVLITALDTDAQAEMLRGIEEYGKSRGCNIAVFLWFTGAFENEKQNQGEINIVKLPDFNLFDGLIVFSDTMHMKDNRYAIEQLLETVTCPIVTVGCKLKNYPCVLKDNYTAMRELVEHFVVDHNLTRIHFVKGVEGNDDAEMRYQAYVDVLTEHGIPVVPERVSPGDFYVTGATLAAKEILQSKEPLPEAIVCANDTMASTICEIFMQRGYRIPEDVLISGYDYTLEGQIHFPRLTTVRCQNRKQGAESCRTILDIIDGVEVAEELLLPDEVVLGESCGCKHDSIENEEERLGYVNRADIIQRKMIHQLIDFEKNSIEGVMIEDWIENMKDFIAKLNPPEFYCCVNDDFVKNFLRTGVMEQEEMGTEKRFVYSPTVKVLAAYREGEFYNRHPFKSKYALDEMFKENTGGKMYLFSPMHYRERTFGYYVFVDSVFPIANPLYVSWLIAMSNSVENIRRQSMLRNAMKSLDDMYIRDSLTGAYNRFGMDRFFAEIKEECMLSNIQMQVSFVDLDGLKTINDKFGHDEGDRIIAAAAEILQKYADYYYVVRYGGDEFVVLGAIFDKSEVEDYWAKVVLEVEEFNEGQGHRAKLSFSHSYEVFKVNEKTYLEECIRQADKMMYAVKKLKKSRKAE